MYETKIKREREINLDLDKTCKVNQLVVMKSKCFNK